MKQDIRVREAVLADAEALARVNIDAMRSAFAGLVPRHLLEWPDSVANWKKGLTEGLGKDVFLDVVQAENGLVVGYVMGGPNQANPLYEGEVMVLNVLPDYQRQGIGALLVRHAAKRLAENGIHSLCVRTLRINPNRSFYERLGGVFVSEQPYDWDGVIFAEYLYAWENTSMLLLK
jgi:ribosomal protein S18 acetylase RimI-like enzyme